jgi:NAD(P)-dependent dehydrogenase (short-subunit alcohol dehydrogenase family)
MPGIVEGRVVVVTGAGRGIGRGHALEFASQGAKVVVNDIGGKVDGTGRSSVAADAVVAAIKDMGTEAIPNNEDVSEWDGARRLIETTIAEFGRLDVVVNNAGILRSAWLAEMTREDWDDVYAVHCRAPMMTTKHASDHWRKQSQAGEPVYGRVINTSSAAGLWPTPPGAGDGHPYSNYSSAKAAIAAFTIAAANELQQYGITVNAISPGGRTRMWPTVSDDAEPDELYGGDDAPFDPTDPRNVSPLLVWLASEEAADVTGRVFESGVGRIGIANGWTHGPSRSRDDRRWDPAELGPVVRELLAQAPAPQTMAG